MKASFYMDDFKSACNRASAVLNMKSVYPGWRGLIFVADRNVSEDSVSIIGRNLDEYCKVTIPARVYESGDVSIGFDDVKKLFNVKGLCEISYSNGIVKVTNGKKTSIVPWFFDDTNDIDISTDDCVYTGKFDEKSFVSDLGLLFPFTEDDSKHNVLTSCFCFDTLNDSIVALDGQSICHKSNVGFSSTGKMHKVPSVAYTHLKKIIGKSDMDVMFETIKDVEYAVFKGADYIYRIKCKDGTYFDYKALFDGTKDSCVNGNFDCNEMHLIASEYNTIAKGDKIPMLLYCDVTNNRFFSSISMESYATSDIIDATVISRNNWHSGFNPYYLKVAMDIFKSNGSESVDFSINPKSEMNISPMVMADGDWKILVLPVRISPNYYNKVMNTI